MIKCKVKNIPTLKSGAHLIVSGRDEWGIAHSSHAIVREKEVEVDEPWDRFMSTVSFDQINAGTSPFISCNIFEENESWETQVKILELKTQIKDCKEDIKAAKLHLVELTQKVAQLKNKK